MNEPKQWIDGNREHRAAMCDVSAERLRQDAKWGEQNHPMVWRSRPAKSRHAGPSACADVGIPSAQEAQDSCADAVTEGLLTWADILVEEVSEWVEAAAIHGDLSDEARTEAVQVAAVALAIIECIDRKRAAEGGDGE